MATILTRADDDAYAMLADLIAEHRTDLADCDVEPRILLLFAASDQAGKPAMKHRGMRCLGQCKVHSYRDKVEGKPDATITLDAEWWEDAPHRRQLALLHHELSHIDRYDGVIDDGGWARLQSRPGDFEFDGFHEVMQIYGDDAPEQRNINGILEVQRQARFDFVPDATTEGVAQ